MARTAAVLASVQRLYDAALTADAWQPALQSVVDLVGGDHAILVARDPAREGMGVATCAGMDERDFARFRSPHAVRWMAPLASALPSGSAMVWSHLLRDRDFERTEFYNEVVRPVHGFYAVAVRDETPTLSTFMAVCRGRKRGDFEAADATMMQCLAPHLATALRVRQRLGAADLSATGAEAALEHLRTGVMIVDSAYTVAFANEAAERLFRESGLRLDRDGLCTPDAAARGELRRLIASCAGIACLNRAGGVVEIPRSGRLPLRILVAPFTPERIGEDAGTAANPLALLLVTDPQQRCEARKAGLKRRFGLTCAEADLAIEIARGDGRDAAARRLGVTVATVRTHLTHIFDKTGTRRQAELVRLVLQAGEEQL